MVGRGKRPRPEDTGGGGSLARFGLTWRRGRRSGSGLPFRRRDGVDGGGLGTDRGGSVWAFGPISDDVSVQGRGLDSRLSDPQLCSAGPTSSYKYLFKII